MSQSRRLPDGIRPVFFNHAGAWRWGWQLLLAAPIVGGCAAIIAGPFFWLALRLR